jgi:hypothetical protein
VCGGVCFFVVSFSTVEACLMVCDGIGLVVGIVSVVEVWLSVLVSGFSVVVLWLVEGWACVFVVFAGTWVFHASLVRGVTNLLRI